MTMGESVKGLDGGAAMAPRGLETARAVHIPIYRSKQWVLPRYSSVHEYPNAITPWTIEGAVRDRVHSGTDVFEALRQVLCGVVRWQTIEEGEDQ